MERNELREGYLFGRTKRVTFLGLRSAEVGTTLRNLSESAWNFRRFTVVSRCLEGSQATSLNIIMIDYRCWDDGGLMTVSLISWGATMTGEIIRWPPQGIREPEGSLSRESWGTMRSIVWGEEFNLWANYLRVGPREARKRSKWTELPSERNLPSRSL